MDENKLNIFLGNVHIGDYVWVRYREHRLFRGYMVKEAEGFVSGLIAGIIPNCIFLSYNEPFKEELRGYICIEDIVDFKKITDNPYYGLEKKFEDNSE